MKIRYIGTDTKLDVKPNKIYEARQLKRGWFGIIDESGEEYAYPPELFEIVEE